MIHPLRLVLNLKNIGTMRRKIWFAAAVMAAVGFVGCKPTEKNYKAAYDAALQKREAAVAADADLGIPEGGLQQLDGPQRRVVNGDTVYLLVERIRFFDGEEHEMHKYNVAVSGYKMKTNCAAQVSDLFTKGYKAFGARNAEGTFYVIAGSFDTLDEAAAFDKAFVGKEKKHVYSGLPGAPLIIESR